jgi:hypothetical protein
MALQRVRAWRERIDRTFANGDALGVQRQMDMDSEQHYCAHINLDVRSRSVGAAVATAGLGELLRVVALTAAPHVDPSVFHELWDKDGLCPMGALLCERCDAMDRRHDAPVLELSIQGESGKRSGVGILHDAIYDWDEAVNSTTEYARLREALQVPLPSEELPPRASVEIVLLVGMSPTDDVALDVRDLKTLLARQSDTSIFRITRVVPRRFAAVATSPHFSSLVSTTTDAGVSTDLVPIHSNPRAGDPDPWQWLYDWIARTSAPGVVVEKMAIMQNGFLEIPTLIKLLEFIRTKCLRLEHLTIQWPFDSTATDVTQRYRALEAVSTALFAPSSRIRLQTLDLDLGELTQQDVAALQRGSAGSGGGSDAEPRIKAMVWKPQRMPERIMHDVVPLFGSASVRDLDINSGQRALSCRLLKNVLQSCPSLTTLTWRLLACEDAHELNDAAWPRGDDSSSQLRQLRISVVDGDDANAVSAIDNLMARVGATLTNMDLWALRGPLGANMATVLVARCPQLRQLEVGNANATFYEHFIQALDDGRCAISNLTAHTGVDPHGNEWMSLLAALTDSRRGVSRTVRQLTLNARRGQSSDKEVVGHAFVAALSTNALLRRAEFVGELSTAVHAKLRAIPPFAGRPLPIRHRLAFLSANEARDSELVLLPRGVVATILEFAGRRTRRYTSSHLLIG